MWLVVKSGSNLEIIFCALMKIKKKSFEQINLSASILKKVINMIFEMFM